MRYLLLPLYIAFFYTNVLAQEAKPINTKEDYYNTKSVKTIFDLGVYKIKLNGDDIYFDEIHGELTSPTMYNNVYPEFNFNNVYQIKDSSNNTYYFRFGWTLFYKNQTIFTNVRWQNNIKPTPTKNFVNFDFSVVDIKFIQFGTLTMCTIGDSQTWWDKAQNLRKYINESYSDLIFIGSHTDVFGYDHEGEGGNNTTRLLKRINNIPTADYYSLLIGTNDWGSDIEATASNVLQITNHLIQLNPNAKIVYLTPIPTTSEDRDLFNQKLSKNLLAKFNNNDQITVLDLRREILKNKDWATVYLEPDGLHQSIEGVRLMGQLIGEKIKTMERQVDYFNND